MIAYVENRDTIARRIAAIFSAGDVVNLGIGLPALVAQFIPEEAGVILHSENGILCLGPAPAPNAVDFEVVNAGGMPATVMPGGSFLDSCLSFAIIRGGRLDYAVLGVLEVDQEGNLANYTIPGKRIPGMGGAMDLASGARSVIAATAHFDRTGRSKMKRRCALPLTASGKVRLVVTDVGYFEVRGSSFFLAEWFDPYTPEWIVAHTDADIVVLETCRRSDIT